MSTKGRGVHQIQWCYGPEMMTSVTIILGTLPRAPGTLFKQFHIIFHTQKTPNKWYLF